MIEFKLPDLGEDIEGGWVRARTAPWQDVALNHNSLVAVSGVVEERLVELLETEVGNAGEEMVREVVVLTHREDNEAHQGVHQEGSCVRQRTSVGVSVLHYLAQHHEEPERGHQRSDPQ